MRRSTVWFFVCAVLVMSTGSAWARAFISVTTTEPGITPDGLCSLAEAIENANADENVHLDCFVPHAYSHTDDINLGDGQTYTLHSPFGNDYGLPTARLGLYIWGNGSTIERADGAPPFGILKGQSMNLTDLTIRNAAGQPAVSASRSLILSRCVITNNEIGIEFHGDRGLQVLDSTVRGNGTGFVNECPWPFQSSISVSIDSSTFTSNRPGGGVAFLGCTESSSLTVINSTFSHNAAPEGGAVSVKDGRLLMKRCTIVNNTAYTQGGGIHADGSDVEVRGSIVAQNTGLNCSISDDSTVSSANNLTDDAWCGFDSATDMSVTDPMLSELDYWGGPTLTIMPLEGSPAIDTAGSYCGRLDQRGYVRPTDGDDDGVKGCDCGAVEFGSKTPNEDRGNPVDPRPDPAFE